MRRGALLPALLGLAAASAPPPAAAQPAPGYRAVDDWAALPDGREWGAVSGVHPDPDGRHLWVLDRCGANGCLGSELDPVLKLDADGRVVASFGAGLMAWPHGFFVDHRGHVWVTDGPTGARAEEAAAEGKGQQVFEFSPTGDVLRTLGRPGVSGRGPDTFTGPSDVLVAPDGEIYVLDGHGAGGNNRVVKLAPDGSFLRDWGTSGPGPAAGELADPHAVAMDSRGRIFVADRGNVRIQIFDEHGVFLEQWTHFGPPSDLFIGGDDVLYATDTQTGALPDWYAARRGPGWTRGIRVGDAATGRVTGFIPSEAEFVAADRAGNVYGAEVPGRRLIRYERAAAPPPGGAPAAGDGVRITPIGHASVQLEHGGTVIHVDPWFGADYSGAKPADLILVTDTPGDHLDPEAIASIRKPDAPVVLPSRPAEARDEAGRDRLLEVPDGIVMDNGDRRTLAGVSVEAVPMYDLIPGEPFHARGEGNGYLVTLGGERIYLAGVTECTPEMRALEDIDVAFVPMNLPHGRMGPEAAAECVRTLRPRTVYPYHYRDGDVEAFRDALSGEPVEVELREWYPR